MKSARHMRSRGNCDPGEAANLSVFVNLLARHQADLWAFILSQAPGHLDVADMLQEANIPPWTSRQKFELGTDFIAWSFTVTRFVILKHLKKEKQANRLVFRRFGCDFTFADPGRLPLAPPNWVLRTSRAFPNSSVCHATTQKNLIWMASLPFMCVSSHDVCLFKIDPQR